jgi:probable F420-dependent oxidoreductase
LLVREEDRVKPLGRVGIWTSTLDRRPWREVAPAAAEIDELGYGALWVGEAVRREAFANAALLLSATERIVVATGIANIWARDPVAMAAGQKTLSEAFPGRFVLGVGVSHPPLIAVRGHTYNRPVAAMAAYLDAMDAAPYGGPPPAPSATARVLAALGPRMLELAARRADGAHPYLVPVEHTVRARAVLGLDRLLCPELAVVADRDPSVAREVARRHLGTYLRLENYSRNLANHGFDESDLAGGGSDRLVDSLVAWGRPAAIAARVADHLAAGADHVAIQVLTGDPERLPVDAWRDLAPYLTGEA